MAALCSRVDCSEPAAAVFGFDAVTALVWLDPYDGESKGAGMLCAEHADTLTPMRGWNLQDRRVRAPRLWAERPRVVTPKRSASRRARRPYHANPEPTAPLPFESRVGAGSELAPARKAAGADAASAAELDHLLDARSPLLARAFQQVRDH
jgi:hypothetical protein